jgi:hypothetical protein
VDVLSSFWLYGGARRSGELVGCGSEPWEVGMSDSASDPRELEARSKRRLELVAVVLLSTTTILTAWSAFQSSKWGGDMSITFSRASTQRIEAARLDGTANERSAIQVSLWTEWVAAEGAADADLAEFFVDRFPEPLATAHADWVAGGGPESGVPSPFAMPSFVVPERTEAEQADRRADQLFAEALRSNQRGDNYTLLTVLFAAVLFFTAMSSRVTERRNQKALLVLAITLALVGIVFLAAFPKLV